MDVVPVETYFYYILFFCFFVALLFFLRGYLARIISGRSLSYTPTILSPEFVNFQYNYLVIYFLMIAADWLQGPYLYKVYSSKGYGMVEIANLYIIGFLSSAIFGPVVGVLSDRFGRRKFCLLYCLIYSFAASLLHFENYGLLILGRGLNGIGTSILMTSFESWMIAEHKQFGFSAEELKDTFAKAVAFGNGVIAIISGVVASFLVTTFSLGPVAPFDLSIILLAIGAFLIATRWNENYGAGTIQVGNITEAFDKNIINLGVIQSLFDSSMYLFVFIWTPSLEQTANGEVILHGWIFAIFMVCIVCGGYIFTAIPASTEDLMSAVLLVSGISLFVPSFTESHTVRLIAFCIFEICCGIYFPSFGVLRSKYVPESIRNTVEYFFNRINLFIGDESLSNSSQSYIVLLKKIESIEVGLVSFISLVVGALLMTRLRVSSVPEHDQSLIKVDVENS